jgi:2-C-methyl-D-erythritol 4-phosphate cytidylyltransferase
LKAIAIIVAGGLGSRMKTLVPKQFMELGGKPLLAHTVSRFAGCRAVDEIVLVLPRSGFQEHQELMAPWKPDNKALRMVPGGKERQDSMANGLDALPAGYDGLVAVHDGARPLVDGALITKVIEMADDSGGAIAGLPVYETLKEVAEDGIVVGTADRLRFYRAQTPQCFRYPILRRALDRAREDNFLGTDEAALVERLGESIRVVAGSETNIKVTTARDLALAEYYLRKELKNSRTQELENGGTEK